MMNEFIAKKMGEALAFEEQTIWILTKAQDAFMCFLTEIEIEGRIGDHKKNIDILLKVALEKKVKDIVEKKAEATKTKLEGMAETYIGDKWDDLAEVLEWTSFAEGAAVAHWGIVKGASEALEIEELLSVCFDAMAQHGAHFDEACDELSGVGNSKALASEVL